MKGATVIFCRLAGGDEDELLALRVPLVVFVAIFVGERTQKVSLAPSED